MRQLFTLLASAMFAASALAADLGVTVNDAWARATAPGQDSGSVQFVITSLREAKLVGISSPSAEAIEIHNMVHEGGKMKMRAVESMALPAGKAVDLGASGNHVMLLKLKKQLKEGDSVPLTLTVQFPNKRKGTVEVDAKVKSAGGGHDMHDMHDM